MLTPQPAARIHTTAHRTPPTRFSAISNGLTTKEGEPSKPWWMTTMLHRFPANIPYDDKLQDTELQYLLSSDVAKQSMAENYVGLPF